jgi:hypothetical protein
MKIKAYIEWKDELRLITLGTLGKNGVFHFRNSQLKKSCIRTLRKTFSHDCPGGTLTIPDHGNSYSTDPLVIERFLRNSQMAEEEGYLVAFQSVEVKKEDNKKYIVTYKKS